MISLMKIIRKGNLSTLDGRNRNQVSQRISGVEFEENEFPHKSMLPDSLFVSYPELKDFCGTSKDSNLAKLFMSVIEDCEKKDSFEGIENLFSRTIPIDCVRSTQGVKIGTDELLAFTVALHSRYFSHTDAVSILQLHTVLGHARKSNASNNASYTAVLRMVYEALRKSKINPAISWFVHCNEAQKAWKDVSQSDTLIPLAYALNTFQIISEFSSVNEYRTAKSPKYSNGEYRVGLRFPYTDVKNIVNSGLKITDISRAYDAGFTTVQEITELTEMPYEWVDVLLTPEHEIV